MTRAWLDGTCTHMYNRMCLKPPLTCTCTCNSLMWQEVSFDPAFIYFISLSMRAVKSLARLCTSTGLPGASLLAYMHAIMNTTLHTGPFRPDTPLCVFPANQIALTLYSPSTTKVVSFSRLLKCLRSLYGKQCGPRSDCSYRSCLFLVHTVCFYTF